jgi:PAS domain-containing protein
VRGQRELENAERPLVAANAELVSEMAAHERLEDERRAAELDLHEVRARFESAFTSAPIGMALVDMDGRWLQVNDALCRITGHTRDALKATTLQAITHPDDVDRDAIPCEPSTAGPSFSQLSHAWGHTTGARDVSLVRMLEANRSVVGRFKHRNGKSWRLVWSTSSIRF